MPGLLDARKGLTALLILYIVNPVMAHTGATAGYHMNHMTGHGLWGMGWTGLFFGLAAWTLLVLFAVYVFQEMRGGGNE